MTPSDIIARRVRAMARASAAGEDPASIQERLQRDIFAMAIREDWASREKVYGAAGIEIPKLPAVPNIEQIRKLRDRLPWAERLADVYDDHARTVAERARDEAANYARDVIADSLGIGGGGPASARERMMRERDWSGSYADMVVRTNMTEAAAAGQIDAARDPDVARVLPALRYEAIRDADVRRGRKQDSGENHLAASGLVAPADWNGWSIVAPPNGYSCRCSVRLVHRRELESLRQPDGSPVEVRPDGTVVAPAIPSAFQAHPDFRGPKVLDRF